MAYPSSLSLLFVLPVLGVGIDIEKTMAGQIEQNDLVLSLFFRHEGFVDRGRDGMGRLGRGIDRILKFG